MGDGWVAAVVGGGPYAERLLTSMSDYLHLRRTTNCLFYNHLYHTAVGITMGVRPWTSQTRTSGAMGTTIGILNDIKRYTSIPTYAAYQWGFIGRRMRVDAWNIRRKSL